MLKILVISASAFYGKSMFAQSVTVATASNAQYVINDLIDLFERRHKIKVGNVVGSSGKLTAQIKSGAPYDIFISANDKYPNYLHEQGYSVTKPVVYARGTAILWTLKELNIDAGLSALTDNNVHEIAIASPKSAPYGELAVEILKEADIYDEVKEKLIYGANISQVNQHVLLKTVDIGISAKSTIFAGVIRNKGKWIELDHFYLDQSLVLLKTNNKSAVEFYNFILSEEARETFEKHGYIIRSLNGN